MKKESIRILVLSGLISALAFIGFSVFKIDIVIYGWKSAFHLANVFVIIGAFLLGPIYGGVAGAIGLTLADLVSGYAIYAPTTFILKLCIALVAGTFAHRVFKLNSSIAKKDTIKFTLISSTLGMLFNVIFDPLLGFIRTYILFSLGINSINGKTVKVITLAKALAKIAAFTTLINAILTVIIVTITYYYIKEALKNIYLYKSGEKDE